MEVARMVPGALVVLFHPSDAHLRNLSHLKQLCASVVAVDNSPVVDSALHDRIREEGVDVIANFNRGGVAGAYNRGFSQLIAKGCQVLFLFDQDSDVPENYFQNMLDAGQNLNLDKFLIGPKVFDINVKRYLPAHILKKFGLEPVPITEEDRGLVPCSSLITSGTVMSAETYRSLGEFREDYFIDHVDTEYSLRAYSSGVPLFVNTALTLKHELSKRIDHKFLFLKLYQWNMNSLRQYYSARNCIHIVRSYGSKFPLLILINIITVEQVLSVILFERDKRKKLVALMAGVMDGFRGTYGSFETCRPRSFAFCSETNS